MSLPKDPMILLSYINTQLRDNYSTLEELGKSLLVYIEEIKLVLSTIDYNYNSELNRFV